MSRFARQIQPTARPDRSGAPS